MRSVADFIGEATKDFSDEMEGKSPMGGFDGPPLDTTRQYRVQVARAEWRQAQGSGKWSFAITFEVIEDLQDEFVGRKFSEYYNIDQGAHEAAKRAFSRFLGESGLDIRDLDQSDNEAFISNFEGVQYVIAPRTWGEDDDRTGVRYLNRDRGQPLLDNIKPPQGRGGGSAKPLKAEISVNKEKGPFDPMQEASQPPQEEPEQLPIKEVAATSPVQLPGAGTSAPVNLPPGLSK
jgi:hypothetical protein